MELNGFFLGFVDGVFVVINQIECVLLFWVNFWIVLFVVGVIIWGFMVWVVIVYCCCKGQIGLLVQMCYNMLIEIFYMIVFFIFVLGMFFFIVWDQIEIEVKWDDFDVEIMVIVKQWVWDFQYDGEEEDNFDVVWMMGIQVQFDVDGNIDQVEFLILVLLVDKKVMIDFQLCDVIYFFWIIDFFYKKDMFIGKDNLWFFILICEGEYVGKCVEFCGEYYLMMLFNVKVVLQDEYDVYFEFFEEKGNMGDIIDVYDCFFNLFGIFGQIEIEEGEE